MSHGGPLPGSCFSFSSSVCACLFYFLSFSLDRQIDKITNSLRTKVFLCVFFAVLGIKLRALCMLGKYTTTDLSPQPTTEVFVLFFFFRPFSEGQFPQVSRIKRCGYYLYALSAWNASPDCP
jgi:hypothetical protein